LPLYILTNDPKHSLKIIEKKHNGLYKLNIILTKPVYNSAIDEPEPIIIDHKYFTWVSVSSLNSWKEFAAKRGSEWTELFRQKLPNSFKRILAIAKKKKNEVEKINTVTSLLNDKIRYMGDWRTIKGRFTPRTLDEIDRSQFGDCKDFSAAVAAILSKLGFKAQIALVMRGMNSLHIMPGFQAFNHAIVKVTGKKGNVYWVDPTNFESMADGLFPDIANKMALILDPKLPGYEKIPEINHKRAFVNLKREWNLVGGGKIIEKGEIIYKNESTLGLIGASLLISDDLIKNAIFKFLANKNLEQKSKNYIKLPKLNSRVVKDITINYGFERKNQVRSTNVGPALMMTYEEPISTICDISQNYVSDIMIYEFPMTFKRQTVIKNIYAQNIESLNKEIRTPWIYVKRKCNMNNEHDLQIDDTVIVYKNLIPREDLRKPEFLRLKDWLEKNFKDVIIVLSREHRSRVL